MTPAAARSVPFFDYRRAFCAQEAELVEIFRDTGRRGAFILQEDLSRFEQNLTRFTGARYAWGVGNATDALLIALRAAGIGPGDEVIFCSHTMVATAAAIQFSGARPVPVECGADHLIDPESVAASITPRTRAILPTQLNGRTADMDALARFGLPLIEDAAQALGSRFNGQAAGTFGIASAISFYPAKMLGCLGDGGAVLTNDETVSRRIAELRSHGCNPGGQVVSWGLNSRLDNLQAAILDFRLRDLEGAIERRRAIAAFYRAALSEVEELVLPPYDGPGHFDVFQNYEVEASRRDELRAFLNAKGVGTLIPWGGNAVHQWQGLGFNIRLPRTEELFRRLLLLPMNPWLSDDDVAYVADCVRRFYR